MKHPHFLLLLLFLSLALLFNDAGAQSSQADANSNTWKSPDDDILKVLHAPQLPRASVSPTGSHLLLTDRIQYPPLSELAGPMLKLAGIRVNPKNNYYHGQHGGTSPRIQRISDGKVTQIRIPDGAEVVETQWAADGQRFAMAVATKDGVDLWLGHISGKVEKVPDMRLNPLLDEPIRWLPDQERLLLRRIGDRGAVPRKPELPIGPKILEDAGASARSTYESRNLLETAYDDELFSYYTSCELVIYNTDTKTSRLVGPSATYMYGAPSPDGKYILAERLKKPWSHDVAWWRFANDAEVWDMDGKLVKKLYSQTVHTEVPVHGEIEGPRYIDWQATAASTLYWMEALDGGDPKKEVKHRDQLMRLAAPFDQKPELVFKAEHRIYSKAWCDKQGVLLLYQRDRMKRWRHVWKLDVDNGTAAPWLDWNEGDRYNNPGRPVYTVLENGQRAVRVDDNQIYFHGRGGTDKGDRPFLDSRNLETGEVERLFRSDKDKFEYFIALADQPSSFIISSESSNSVPNYHMCSYGEAIETEEGEGTRTISFVPITNFEDPCPELRGIDNKLVRYKRDDGVELSFKLLLPPGYKKGTRVPTVVYAYPLEYSSSETAGQVRGSSNRFIRLYGASHKYFLMRGYAVLDNTAMPMVGDPETVYDTFVPQLVSDAEAAVAKAIEIGVADPDRIGIIGHSHGGLMVANALAHTDLFCAGIARSGSYNKTNQPFGFQGERRSLFEATDSYIDCSPTFFAHQVNEPILIVHGADDSNPGTLSFQSEVFYEAVRGSGGTARLVMLPFEDHSYRARESIEHVLWEQLNWFDKHVKNREVEEGE